MGCYRHLTQDDREEIAAILAKTGVSRRAELTRLVIRLLLPIEQRLPAPKKSGR